MGKLFCTVNIRFTCKFIDDFLLFFKNPTIVIGLFVIGLENDIRGGVNTANVLEKADCSNCIGLYVVCM